MAGKKLYTMEELHQLLPDELCVPAPRPARRCSPARVGLVVLVVAALAAAGWLAYGELCPGHVSDRAEEEEEEEEEEKGRRKEEEDKGEGEEEEEEEERKQKKKRRRRRKKIGEEEEEKRRGGGRRKRQRRRQE